MRDAMLLSLMSGSLLLLPLLAGCEAEIGESSEPGGIYDQPVPGDDDGDGIPDTLIPGPTSIKRLTASQYFRSLEYLTGVSIPEQPLEHDTPSNGFTSIGNARGTVSARGVEQYESTAYAVAQHVLASTAAREQLVSCDPSASGCYATFLNEFAPRVWRRPVAESELTQYIAVAEQASTTLGDPWAGIEFAFAGLIQSPNFLYRRELGDGPAANSPTIDGGTHFSDYEMASRVSFALCDRTPDDELLRAAAAGELTVDATLRAQVERLAGSEECGVRATAALLDAVFDLEALEEMAKDSEEFPLFTETLGHELRESFQETVRAWAQSDVPYPEFFTRNDIALNNETAGVYGESPPDDIEVVETDAGRSGLLTHPAMLARQAHLDASSATRRGKFVRVSLLCATIPEPPADVGELPEPSPDAPTARDRLANHAAGACAGCHSVMDPIGLALENFDGIGAFRTHENGALIDPSGQLDGVAFDDASGLGSALSAHDDLLACLVRNFYRYASGHVETPGETRSIALVEAELSERALLRTLLVELMMSEGFRTAGDAQ